MIRSVWEVLKSRMHTVQRLVVPPVCTSLIIQKFDDERSGMLPIYRVRNRVETLRKMTP